MVHVSDAPNKEMRLLTSQRVNLLGVSQEQGKLGEGRLANVNSALEIEPRPYRRSSPTGWLKQGFHPLGLSYCLKESNDKIRSP